MATNYNKDHHNATPLYNGNISALTTDYLTTGITPLVKFFRYDKLNRIKWMKTASTIGNSQSNPGNNFATNYTYDFNGNLAALSRNNHASTVLHDINYQYSTGKNRLNSITSIGLASSSYQYDAIGNLIRDTGEGLEISWNAAGKVDTIWKNGNVLSTFRYSATGQRQMKKTRNITDYYIHDASGNVMCIYRVSKRDFKAVERPIYGAKRLGELKQQVDLTTPTNPSIPPFTIGMRQYELTDHLGNVMATILDRRQPMTLANSDAYLPWIVSTTDYYPFGYPIPNRSTNIGGYRYFFNGQEGDNEVLGEVANFGYEFRQYDSRLARWWSVDPKWSEYPGVSPFVFCNGSPIMMADLKGEEAWEPDKQALANDKEVRFIAQKDDDLHTLAIQTGLDYGYLNSLYGGMTFNEGDSYSFDKIPAIAKMNEFLNNGMNSNDYNCRSFALFVNGIYNTDFTSSPSIISEVFQNVSPVSQAQTGDVVTMADSYENFYNSYWTSVENPYKNSKSEFRAYYTKNFSTQITHYGVVLLKNPDGNTISWIIEKRGKNAVEISPFPSSQKVDFEGSLFQPYNPIPVQPNQSSFIYRRN